MCGGGVRRILLLPETIDVCIRRMSVFMSVVVTVLLGSLISSATVIGRAERAIRSNPSATVLSSVCSAVTVECFVSVLHGRAWRVCCYIGKKALLQCLSNY